MNTKIAVLALLGLAVASALPTDKHHDPYKKEPPKPYSFGYGINDEYKGLNFAQKEESDGKVVSGSYTVQLPDGRKQTVTYTADHDRGFHANVQYYGDAEYAPHSPPFIVKPKYKPEEPPHPVYKPH